MRSFDLWDKMWVKRVECSFVRSFFYQTGVYLKNKNHVSNILAVLFCRRSTIGPALGGVLGSVIVLLVIILVVKMNIWYPHVLKANSESARVSVFREGKSRTDTSKVILQLSCIYLQHDHGHYTKSLTPIKEFKESLKLLAPMDRIREQKKRGLRCGPYATATNRKRGWGRKYLQWNKFWQNICMWATN